ncbi:hypothetical protein ACQ4PT_004553 [Festuca glaucescens]
MAGREMQPPRAGVPPASSNTLRQPILPRGTPGRGGAERPVGTVTGSATGSGVSVGQGEQQTNLLQSSRFEAGGSSSQGCRDAEKRREEDFATQGFGGFHEGYYEGNNGNRFNGGANRYQRRFNNNENPPPNLNSQNISEVTQVVAATSGGSASQSMEASPAENVVNNLAARAQKKIDKVQCLRCGEYGHFADTCAANMCLYCEKTSHDSKDCPLHAMPKPVAITYGVSRNELMFHEVSASSEVTFKHDSGKLGKISVTGGSLSAEEIVKVLKWIIPCNHQWDLRPTDDDAFKVLFPLRVHGVCYKDRCDYLSLFGVGSLIGKTKEVDMAFTRTHSMAWMLVEVTRVELIPTTTVDHTYDGEVYGLIFKVEGEHKDKSDVHMQDADPTDDPNDGEGNGKEDTSSDPKGDPVKPAPASKPIPPKMNNAPVKQVQNLSLPTLRVGQIDCYESARSKLVF